MIRPIIHYGFHLLIPLFIALIFYPKRWKIVLMIFIGAMLIDFDHLLAQPVFDPNRCSIGFHPLHSYYAILVYAILFLIRKTRILGFALLWHIITDQIDCWMI